MKKLLVSLSLFLVLFLNTAPFFPSLAQSPSPAGNPFTTGNETWYTQSFPTWFTKVYDKGNPTEIFGERYTAAQVQWVVFSLASLSLYPFKEVVSCAFTQDINVCKEATDVLTASIPEPKKYADDSSFWKFVTSRSSLSGIGYIKNLASKLNPAQTTYAQTEGFGYNSLDIARSTWSGLRNLAFSIIVIIALYYSFMIMLRQKISPQAVISIETAIPKLVVSALLVTFSFAIAGFFIDLMYVVGGVIAYIIPSALSFGVYGDYFWKLFVGEFGGVGILLFLVVYFVLFLVAAVFSLGAFFISGPLNAISTPLIGIIGVIVTIGIFIVLLINLFKILFMMIKTVANIYLAVIFAPLQLVFSGVFKTSSFTSWAMNLVSELAVFPFMLIFLSLALYFLIVSLEASVAVATTSVSIVWDAVIAPILSIVGISLDLTSMVNTTWNPPFFGNGWEGFIFLGISFGLMSALPKAAEMAKSAIMKGTMSFDSGIGASVKSLGNLGGMAYQGFESRVGHTIFSRMAGLPPSDEGVLDPRYTDLINGKRVAEDKKEAAVVLLRNLAKGLSSGNGPV